MTEILCLHPILEIKLKYDTNRVRKITLKEQYIILINFQAYIPKWCQEL